MKKIAISLAASAVAMISAAAPVGAGAPAPPPGTVVITPDPVEQGGSVTIANTDDEWSTCIWAPSPGVKPEEEVELEVVDPDSESIVVETIATGPGGAWSFEVTDLTKLGTYTVYASCDAEDVPAGEAAPAVSPYWDYEVGTFEVIAQATTTTTAAPTTTVAPTTTTAATSAVSATPSYTG